jgi:hypothetical protein
MTRKFLHQFEPEALSPVPRPSDEVELTVQEIEAAGIAEVLQRSGARVGSWSLLEALLEPGDSRFLFREPLGAAREVKVAASGLFGRFVARAYLTRYLKLAFFENLGTKEITLNKKLCLRICRAPKTHGDLPDWVACSGGLGDITIAEAKGCHDKSGPKNTLERAWKQAKRVHVLAGNKRVAVKRIAIATRWASNWGGAAQPIIGVRDPVEEGEPDTAQFLDEVGVGLARLHIANLLEPLGYPGLAQSLRDLLIRNQPTLTKGDRPNARIALDNAQVREVRSDSKSSAPEIGPLVGAFVTRAGPLSRQDISHGDAETLRSLGLSPVFVGIEREVIEAAISGDPERIRAARKRDNLVRREGIFADFAGTCVAHVGGRTQVD